MIDARQVTEYCLSPEHDDGRHKAQLFRRLVGLNPENAALLLDALAQVAGTRDAVVGKKDEYGQRYVIDFDFTGPTGTATIRSAWIVRTGD